MDDRAHELWQEHPNARPDPPGGYIGTGSRVWSWLLLTRLGAVPLADGLRRATAAAALIPEAVNDDEAHEVLGGMAGAIVPLLRLTELTGDHRWRDESVRIGDRLADLARPAPTGVRWPGARSADGIGGFAHGALGIAWALARLAGSTGQERFAELAEAGLRFQESLYDHSIGGWQDLRKEPGAVANNWCYGSDGIAVVASDLSPDRFPYWRELLGRAAAATWAGSFGSTHTLCHGDLGAWEAMDRAFAAGAAPPDVTRDALDARVVSSLTEFGPHWAVSSRMFRPGLLAGAGGIAYQLLRMHRDSDLPSLLLPDPAG